MRLTPDALYYQLGSLAAEIPELASGPITPEIKQWILRAAVLVETAGDLADRIQMRVATENLEGMLRERNAQTIWAIVQRTLAKAEREAPRSRRAHSSSRTARSTRSQPCARC
jgi:hypothetical protein